MSQAPDVEPDPYLIPLSFDGTEVLSVDLSQGRPGWAAYFSDQMQAQGAQALVRLAPESGSGREIGRTSGVRPDPTLEIREVRVSVGAQIAGFPSALLREVPVLRIEAAINQSDHRYRLTAQAGIAAPALLDAGPGGLRYRTPPTRGPRVAARALTIEDPGGYRKPDQFYADVAELYLYLASLSGRPAHHLAEANDVPVATVHRWIREAKIRKVLRLPAHRIGPAPPRPPGGTPPPGSPRA